MKKKNRENRVVISVESREISLMLWVDGCFVQINRWKKICMNEIEISTIFSSSHSGHSTFIDLRTIYHQKVSRISGTKLLNFKEKARDNLSCWLFIASAFWGNRFALNLSRLKIFNDIRLLLINSCLCLLLLFRRQWY